MAGIALLKAIDRIPTTGLSNRIGTVAAKKHSHHLQVIHPRAVPGSSDLQGRLRITAFEALAGTRKRVSLAAGLRRRTYQVRVPPGMQAGKSLRLKGLGQTTPQGHRGDLYLKIELESW